MKKHEELKQRGWHIAKVGENQYVARKNGVAIGYSRAELEAVVDGLDDPNKLES